MQFCDLNKIFPDLVWYSDCEQVPGSPVIGLWGERACVCVCALKLLRVSLGFWWKVKGGLGLWGLTSLCIFKVLLLVLAFIGLYAVHLIFIGIYTVKWPEANISPGKLNAGSLLQIFSVFIQLKWHFPDKIYTCIFPKKKRKTTSHTKFWNKIHSNFKFLLRELGKKNAKTRSVLQSGNYVQNQSASEGITCRRIRFFFFFFCSWCQYILNKKTHTLPASVSYHCHSAHV